MINKMRRFIFAAIAIAAILSSAGCFLAPELALEFELVNVVGLNTNSVTIYYYIENVSGTDLDNCKLEFEITTNEPFDNEHKIWTWGHSLGMWDSVSDDIPWSAPDGYEVIDVELIGAGMDDPEEE